MPKLVAVDLFCGAGGFSSGLVRSGFEVAVAVDSWEKAVQTYRSNFKHPVVCADVSKLSRKDFAPYLKPFGQKIDLLVGGPPCQGFSIQRIGDDDDRRNNLVLEFARLVSELSPTMFIMENVLGILGKRGMGLVNVFSDNIRSAGYDLQIFRVNAANYGIPQLRKRVFFIGWKRELGGPFVFPKPTYTEERFLSVKSAIDSLPSVDDPKNLDPLHRRMKMSPLNFERLKLIPPGGGFEDLPKELRVNCHRNGADKIGHRNVYGRLHPDEPAVTITARFDSFTRGKFAHPSEHRNISLREGARLQSFSDSHVFVGSQEEIAALIGNAVPPKLAEKLLKSVDKHIRKMMVGPNRRKSGITVKEIQLDLLEV